jgi:ABC-type glycerol-3-phosphate transport system substrate-binding protein
MTDWLDRHALLKTPVLAFLALALLALPGCSGLPGLVGGEPVTLRFVYFEDAANYEPLAQMFHEQNPNITIELDPVTFGGGGDPFRTFQTKLEGADALRISTMNLDQEMMAKFLTLDPFLSADLNFPADDFIAGSLDGMMVSGKLLGLPAAVNPYVMFYEPARLQAAGISPPLPGWTLEDFMTLAVTLNNSDESLRGTEAYMFGFCSHPQFSDPIMFSYIFGGGIFDDLNQIGAPTLNSQANIDALAWYTGLHNEFGVMPPANSTRYMGELIVRSNCGFWMDFLDRQNFGRWMEDKPLGAVTLPVYNSAFTVATIDSYAILSESLHPEETWEWLRFLMDQPTAAGSLVPPRRSHIESEEFASRAAPDVVSVARGLPQQTVILGLEMFSDPRLGQVLELYTDAAMRVLNEEIDAKTALDLAQQEAEQAFGR